MNNANSLFQAAEDKRQEIIDNFCATAKREYDRVMDNVTLIKQLPASLFNMPYRYMNRMQHYVSAVFYTEDPASSVLILNALPLLPLSRVDFDGVIEIAPEELADWPRDDMPAESHNTVLGPVDSRIICDTSYLQGDECGTNMTAWIKLEDGTLVCLHAHVAGCADSPVHLLISADGKPHVYYTSDEFRALWPVFELSVEPAEGAPSSYFGYKPAEGTTENVRTYDHALSADEINKLRAEDEIG